MSSVEKLFKLLDLYPEINISMFFGTSTPQNFPSSKEFTEVVSSYLGTHQSKMSHRGLVVRFADNSRGFIGKTKDDFCMAVWATEEKGASFWFENAFWEKYGPYCGNISIESLIRNEERFRTNAEIRPELLARFFPALDVEAIFDRISISGSIDEALQNCIGPILMLPATIVVDKPETGYPSPIVEGEPDTMVGEAKAQWDRLLSTLTELSPAEVNELEDERHALHFILRTYGIPVAQKAIQSYLEALKHNKLHAPIELRAIRVLLELEKDLDGKQREELRLEYIFEQLQDIRLSLKINKGN